MTGVGAEVTTGETSGQRRRQLFIASLLMLFFELAFIRWIPGQVRVIAYFTNFVLIACFLGIGVGILVARRAIDAVRWAGVAVLGLVGLAIVFRPFTVVTKSAHELLLVYEGQGPEVSLYLLLAVFYAAIAVAMVPFGQAVGRAFGSEAPLLDYIVNLAGSIGGILLFFLFSLLSAPAWSWYLLGAALLPWMMPPRWGPRALTVTFGLVTALAVWTVDRGTIWSPYHKIEITPTAVDAATGVLAPYRSALRESVPLPLDVAFNVRVNDDFYQVPADLSDYSVARFPGLRPSRLQYDYPFRLKPDPDRVLIVGAGTGNDAAAALRCGAGQVDVVDIDPVIVDIGRRMHPEDPYSDPRITVHVDDARHFFHHARPGYDVVVFGLLDSHRLLSSMSSLRLDSYVFTVESFRAVRRLLKPDGIQVTAFALRQPRFTERLRAMLWSAYEREPIALHEHGVPTIGLVMVSSPNPDSLGYLPPGRPLDPEAEPATDDWPFFYAAGRSIPREYLIALALVALASALALAGVSRPLRLPDAHFFFLGAGFMLLETRNITSLALIFGSTWYVNSVVFLSILLMAMLSAALLASGLRVRLPLVYWSLLAAVAVSYVLPLERIAAGSLLERVVIGGGLTAAPLLFSGIVFAHSFKATADPARALGSNILGGVLGGLVEYLGMITGLRFLLLLVALFYVLSWVVLQTARASARPSA